MEGKSGSSNCTSGSLEIRKDLMVSLVHFWSNLNDELIESPSFNSVLYRCTCTELSPNSSIDLYYH